MGLKPNEKAQRTGPAESETRFYQNPSRRAGSAASKSEAVTVGFTGTDHARASQQVSKEVEDSLVPAFAPSNLTTSPARIVPSTTGRVLLPSLSHAFVLATPG